jgi:hypothetical protein
MDFTGSLVKMRAGSVTRLSGNQQTITKSAIFTRLIDMACLCSGACQGFIYIAKTKN